MKTGVYSLLFISILFVFGCGNTPSNMANNTNTVFNTAPANTPHVIPPANTNSNSNTNAAPKTATTPGNTSTDQIKKQPKPGATATPGIPDPETMRKLMGQPQVNVKAPASNGPIMKSNQKLGSRIQ